jgi:hypothetical protein
MLIVDSTTNRYDNFYWTVYNTSGESLISLDFDVYYLGVYYLLDGTNDFVDSGVTFSNDVPYTLSMTLDLGRNRWSARLDNQTIATNQPLTTVGAKVDVGDIDAAWLVYDPANPGDNFMVFDDYRVAARPDASPPPATPSRLSLLGRTPAGQVLLRVFGPAGSRQAVEASSNLQSWTALRTNVVTDTYFDFLDETAGIPARFYRARAVP